MVQTEDEKEIDRMYYDQLEAELKVDLDVEVEMPPIALSYGTHTYSTMRGKFQAKTAIGTYGNFSFIQAPPKSFKSFFVSMLVSSYLNSGNKFASEMKSERDGRDVMHFDTEQGLWHCLRGFRRSADMAGVEDGYLTYSLRTIDYKKRLGFIEHKLASAPEGSVGLVVIDGIADLVADVNDIDASNKVVQKLMEWSSIYNCHIVTVIHSNYGSNKPTGHLGSFCEKKCETQISLERDEDTKRVTVTCKRSRNRGFEPFEFIINDRHFPEVIGSESPNLNF
jgi:hypothetical protein